MSTRDIGYALQGCLVKIHDAEMIWRTRVGGLTKDEQIDTMIKHTEGAIDDANEALRNLRALRDFRKEYYSNGIGSTGLIRRQSNDRTVDWTGVYKHWE